MPKHLPDDVRPEVEAVIRRAAVAFSMNGQLPTDLAVELTDVGVDLNWFIDMCMTHQIHEFTYQ